MLIKQQYKVHITATVYTLITLSKASRVLTLDRLMHITIRLYMVKNRRYMHAVSVCKFDLKYTSYWIAYTLYVRYRLSLTTFIYIKTIYG